MRSYSRLRSAPVGSRGSGRSGWPTAPGPGGGSPGRGRGGRAVGRRCLLLLLLPGLFFLLAPALGGGHRVVADEVTEQSAARGPELVPEVRPVPHYRHAVPAGTAAAGGLLGVQLGLDGRLFGGGQ